MNDRVPLLVSVVIPSYNHGRYLGRALQSILDQTYTNWEVIVIDNHSTDKTDEVMTSFTDPRITFLKIHNNGIIAASRNVGIRAAKGEWIAFLDSDDWWTADKLQFCFNCINDKVDLVYHDLEIDSDKQRLFSRKMLKSWQVKTPVLIDLLLRGNVIVNSSVVVRKSILDKLNGINESTRMIAAEDFNTWLRISQLTEKFLYLPSSLGYYLNHNQSISKKKNMSMPTRSAVEEFLPVLKSTQKLQLEVNLRYISLRYNCLTDKYSDIKDDLKFLLRYGNVVKKIKALILCIMMIIKGIERFEKSK